jgi:hypothetical protein
LRLFLVELGLRERIGGAGGSARRGEGQDEDAASGCHRNAPATPINNNARSRAALNRLL